MNCAVGLPPADDVWERPRRPQDSSGQSGPRGPWIAFWSVLATIAVGGWFAFAPEPEGVRNDETATATPMTEGTAVAGEAASGFRILHASWGAVNDRPPPAPPEPANPTEWQQRERVFHEMGRDRWKGTDIFVRRETR